MGEIHPVEKMGFVVVDAVFAGHVIGDPALVQVIYIAEQEHFVLLPEPQQHVESVARHFYKNGVPDGYHISLSEWRVGRVTNTFYKLRGTDATRFIHFKKLGAAQLFHRVVKVISKKWAEVALNGRQVDVEKHIPEIEDDVFYDRHRSMFGIPMGRKVAEN
jgi:hypothetical protein